MKSAVFTILIALAAALCAPTAAYAQGGPPPWAGEGQGRKAQAAPADPAEAEFAALDRFLAMTDAELDATQQAIARVRAMSPKEREAMRAQIAAFHRLPSERRDEIRVGWGWHDPQDRDDWQAMVHAKSPADRAAIQQELLALEPSARQARKHALLEAWRRERAAPTPPAP